MRWSNLKFDHADAILRALQVEIVLWNGPAPVSVLAVKADSRRVEFQLQVTDRPPVEHWSLMLGDAVHNLRSALDTCAWEMATVDPAIVPAMPTKIYFPTAKDESDWSKRWVPSFSDIQAIYLDRMRKLQGFENLLAPENPLLDLQALDIADKHRGLLRADVGFETAHFRAQLRPPFGQTTFSGTLTPFRSTMVSIRQGEAIGGYTADMDFLLPAQEPQPATVIPVIELNGKTLRLTDFTSLIAHWVRYALDTVRYDTEEAAQRLIDAGYATVMEEGLPRRIEMVTPL